MHYQVIISRRNQVRRFVLLGSMNIPEVNYFSLGTKEKNKKKAGIYFLGIVWKLISSFRRHRVHLYCVKQTSTEIAKNTVKDLVCLHSPIKTRISLKRCTGKYFQQFYCQMYRVFFLCQASWFSGLPRCLFSVDSAKLQNHAQTVKFGIVPQSIF